MSDYKKKYHNRINWAVIARNDERKLNRNCKGCKHLSRDYTCRYLLDMGPGHSRVRQGIKMHPDGGCDLYTSAKHEKSSVRPGILLTKGAAQKMREIAKTDPEKHLSKLDNNVQAQNTALALYNKGAGDAQIANTLCVTKQTVFNWRKANGLPSNYHKFRKENP